MVVFVRFFLTFVLSLICIPSSSKGESETFQKTELADDIHGSVTTSKSSFKSPYWIIIDGGSTGSRLHIFEFVKDTETDDNDDAPRCIRRGSKRVNKPLSAFARTPSQMRNGTPLDPAHVAKHMLPLFEFAVETIPSQYYGTTEVRYSATAGMRLVEESEQHLVYDALYKGLMTSVMLSKDIYFPFSQMKRSDIDTLSGELEGYFGAVAANYLHGTIDASLKLKKTQNGATEVPIGALDMGGSSTQLVFLSGDSVEVERPSTLNEKDFFSTSYLSYGVDQMRMRLWDTLVEDDRVIGKPTGSVVMNPCSFKGFTAQHKGYYLLGTGDVLECTKYINRHIPSLQKAVTNDYDSEAEKEMKRIVGDVEHPPIQGQFFAMSLYFFTLDSLRTLTNPNEALHLSWPNPSIQELYDALHSFCGRSWAEDLYEIRHDAHRFTNPDVLQHRCMEAVYIVTLLRDGYGFEPSSRSITFTYDIDGSEVEWTLGMVLSLYSEREGVHTDNSDEWRSNSTGDAKIKILSEAIVGPLMEGRSTMIENSVS